MRALAFDAFGGPLTDHDLPVPVAPPGGAVVEVHATGICRSDWHAWMGHDSDVARLPHVPGHEFAGVVSAVGDGVDPAWLGRAVTAPFVYACGSCAECRQGAGQVCPQQEQPGFTLPGSFAEYVVVTSADTNLVALPDGLEPALAAGLGCRVATAWRAVVQRGRVTDGEAVVVLGCGGVGLAAVAIAASRGARVVAVDRAPDALTAAARLGADHCFRWPEVGASSSEPHSDADPETPPAADAARAVEELVTAIRSATGGAHLTLDCIGSPTVAAAAIGLLRPLGRHVQVGLLPPAVGPVALPMGLVIGRELEILGTHGLAARDYAGLLDEVTTGRLDLAALLSPAPVGGLADAAALLPRMGSEAFGGIRVVDPRR